jgi:hypothetical protein
MVTDRMYIKVFKFKNCVPFQCTDLLRAIIIANSYGVVAGNQISCQRNRDMSSFLPSKEDEGTSWYFRVVSKLFPSLHNVC